MAGIYIHIPFCRKACHYCNFHFSTSLQLKNDFITALLKEIKVRKDYIEQEPVETIYFGGGTPSLLSQEELKCILNSLNNEFSISPHAEITLEANPDDINRTALKSWKEAGINRLSIGVQSFFDEDLQWMNRAHTAKEAHHAIRIAQEEGFSNLTIDLIYGSPGLTDERWERNVQAVLELGIPHLSCYALTVEPGTALQHLIRKKNMADVVSEDQARQLLLLMDWMDKAGYEHYEISNFSLPGSRSRHNSSYWKGKKYIGFGPSAHSFNGSSRQWNISNNALYIQGILNGQSVAESELLSPSERLNEYIMISLRTIEGIDLQMVETGWGSIESERISREIEVFIREGRLQLSDKRIKLTREGKLFADGIAASLFQS